MSDPDDTVAASSDSLTAMVDPAPQGRVAGRYRIDGLLGVGGMGRVYRAHDEELDELVALKMLRPDLLDSGEALARFRQEVKLARQVTHPNVARIFDIGEHEGQKFMTMELVDGRTLVDELSARGALPEADALRLFAHICRGVASAHSQRIIHRDLKPGNVMLERGGRVVVTDFGLARGSEVDRDQLTMGQVVGTPAYMSPEQVAAMPVEPASDVYALGLILFEMLAGRPAWRGSSPVMVAAQRMMEDAPRVREVRSDVGAEVDALVARCLARDASERFVDAQALLHAVESLTGGSGSDHEDPSSEVEMAQTLVSPARLRRIAVLPFVNASEDENTRAAVGLREDLMDVLSMTPGLRVRHGGAPDGDPIAQGRELDVDVVVTGVVRRRDDTLRVSARALGVADGFQLWAGRFERPVAQATALNDEVAQRVADALSAGMAPKRGVEQTSGAAELYFELREAQHASFGAALGEDDGLESALARASSMALDDPLILATLLTVRARTQSIFGHFEVDETVRRQLNHLQAVAGHLPGTWVAKGVVEFYALRQPAAAVLSLRRALAIDPGQVDALGTLGFILAEAGCLDEADELLMRALWSDPLSPSIRAAKCQIHALRGEWSTIDTLLHELDLPRWRAQRSMLSARLSLWAGRRLWRPEDVPELIEDSRVRYSVELNRAVFDRRADLADLRRFREMFLGHTAAGSRASAFIRQMAAEQLAWLGENDEAWQLAKEAESTGLVDALWLERCPPLQPLRERPEAQAMIEAAKARGLEVRRAYESPLPAASGA